LRSCIWALLAGFIWAGGVSRVGAQESDFPALAQRANAAREAERLDEAVSLYRQALLQRTDWAEGWFYLGALLYDQNAYRGAADAFGRAYSLCPKDGKTAAMLGLSEAKLSRGRAAIEHLEQAFHLGAGADENLRRVMLFTEASLRLDAGEFNRAQETLGRLARMGLAEDSLLDALGEAVLGVRPVELASADSEIRALIRQAGEAERRNAVGDVAAATEAYRRLAEGRTFHNAQFAYGRFLLEHHEDAAAVEAFQREIAGQPRHLLARLGIAGTLASTDPAAALPYAEQAVSLAPQMAEAHYLLGVCLAGTGSLNRAIVELETARRLDSKDARVRFALGDAYAKVHRMREATQERAEFARLSKENSQ